MNSAFDAWPEDDNWEVIGADDYADPNDADPDSSDDSDMFDSPSVYGAFDSFTPDTGSDVPGCAV